MYAQTAPTNAPPGDQRRLAIEQKLSALKSEIVAVKAVIEAKNKEQSALARDVQKAELAIAESAKAVVQINGELSRTQSELENLDAQQIALAQNLKSERNTLARLLRSAYAIGQLEQVKLALSQAKIARVGRVLAYHTYVNRSRIVAITKIRAGLDQLAAVQRQISEKRAELVALLNQESQRSAVLKDQRATREALLVQLRAELEVGGQRMAALDSDIDQLNDLLSRLTDLLADIPKTLPNAMAFAKLRGRAEWPIRGDLVREFGATLEGGRPSSGILIAPGKERGISVIAGGRVAFADWLRGFGMLMIVDHGDGYLSLYGQCETLLRAEGDWLEAGTLVATAGNDPIHFEIRSQGQPVDPMRWLRK